MSHDTTDLAGDVYRQPHDDGYTVHRREIADGRELSGKHYLGDAWDVGGRGRPDL